MRAAIIKKRAAIITIIKFNSIKLILILKFNQLILS
jgi:hypothetical protein